MTESQWVASADPAAMLKYLLCGSSGSVPATTSDRKLRLFACAVARLLEDTPSHPERTAVIETCEQAADGELSQWGSGRGGLVGARKSIQLVWGWTWAATCEDIARGLSETFIQTLGNAGSFYRQDEVANLFREIIGNPFRPATITELMKGDYNPHFGNNHVCVCGHTYYRHFDTYEDMEPVGCKYCQCDTFALAPHWITPTILSIAQAIHDGVWDEIGVLRDALLDSGCDDEQILQHLAISQTDSDPAPWEHRERADYSLESMKREMDARLSPAPLHVRGCWVIDCILGLS